MYINIIIHYDNTHKLTADAVSSSRAVSYRSSILCRPLRFRSDGPVVYLPTACNTPHRGLVHLDYRHPAARHLTPRVDGWVGRWVAA